MTPTPKRTNAETVAEFEEKFPLASKCTWNDGIYKNDPFHDVTAKDWLLAALEAKDREREAAVLATWEKALALIPKPEDVRADMLELNMPKLILNFFVGISSDTRDLIIFGAREDGHEIA